MTVKGTFEVRLEPQKDETAPVGRMLIDKAYHGDLKGRGTGQMISKRLENGGAAYFAIEEFEGTLNGKNGGFTLLHRGSMNPESQSLDIMIMEGSGSGKLQNITGSLDIIQKDGEHFYELEYEL